MPGPSAATISAIVPNSTPYIRAIVSHGDAVIAQVAGGRGKAAQQAGAFRSSLSTGSGRMGVAEAAWRASVRGSAALAPVFMGPPPPLGLGS